MAQVNHRLGIYIQVPFCQTKCTYCNFHTGVASPSAYAPYARAAEREITNWRALYQAAGLPSADRLVAQGATADTIYLGGGTPSLFDPADLARILDAVHSEFCSPDPAAVSSRARAASTTLEADPETITPEKLRRGGRRHQSHQPRRAVLPR